MKKYLFPISSALCVMLACQGQAVDIFWKTETSGTWSNSDNWWFTTPTNNYDVYVGYDYLGTTFAVPSLLQINVTSPANFRSLSSKSQVSATKTTLNANGGGLTFAPGTALTLIESTLTGYGSLNLKGSFVTTSATPATTNAKSAFSSSTITAFSGASIATNMATDIRSDVLTLLGANLTVNKGQTNIVAADGSANSNTFSTGSINVGAAGTLAIAGTYLGTGTINVEGAGTRLTIGSTTTHSIANATRTGTAKVRVTTLDNQGEMFDYATIGQVTEFATIRGGEFRSSSNTKILGTFGNKIAFEGTHITDSLIFDTQLVTLTGCTFASSSLAVNLTSPKQLGLTVRDIDEFNQPLTITNGFGSIDFGNASEIVMKNVFVTSGSSITFKGRVRNQGEFLVTSGSFDISGVAPEPTFFNEGRIVADGVLARLSIGSGFTNLSDQPIEIRNGAAISLPQSGDDAARVGKIRAYDANSRISAGGNLLLSQIGDWQVTSPMGRMQLYGLDMQGGTFDPLKLGPSKVVRFSNGMITNGTIVNSAHLSGDYGLVQFSNVNLDSDLVVRSGFVGIGDNVVTPTNSFRLEGGGIAFQNPFGGTLMVPTGYSGFIFGSTTFSNSNVTTVNGVLGGHFVAQGKVYVGPQGSLETSYLDIAGGNLVVDGATNGVGTWTSTGTADFRNVGTIANLDLKVGSLTRVSGKLVVSEDLTNEGKLEIPGRLESATYAQIGGETIVDGSLSIFGQYQLFGGSLRGSGVVETTGLRNRSKIILDSSSSPLKVMGSFMNLDTGTIQVDWSGDGIQHILVNGDVSLAGTLAVHDLRTNKSATDWFDLIVTNRTLSGNFEYTPVSGYEIRRLSDRVQMRAVPEPASISCLVLGVLMMRRKSTRRSRGQ